MSVYRLDDLIAYEVSNEIVCPECLRRNDQVTGAFEEDDRDKGELLIICDRCNGEC